MSGKTLTRADLAETVVQKVGLPRNESQELVELVIKVSPPESFYKDQWAELRTAVDAAGVTLIDRVLTRGELLAFLNASDCYISLHRSEGIGLTCADVELGTGAHLRAFGKGRKERICPLWPETVALLKAFLRKQPRGEDETIFVNRYGRPLGAGC